EDIRVDNLYGIKVQITEVLYNLLDNAYEAIEAKYEGLKEEEKSNYKGKIKIIVNGQISSVIIEIRDNGIGIKGEDKLKIFAPFFTTKSSYKPLSKIKSGTGIGMYVAKRLIEENHKGRIWFESEYNKGTTFYIELPRKREK
ncbi:MAG: ATP-binding protein, partial [Candidatus Omnitrophica bacterium]|nr:ATP-binding protein [Candidatus Omnitrophota bacterium]